jgi:hypothetical protein
MLKVKLVAASLGIVVMSFPSIAIFSQTLRDAPAAAIPSQILTARKVFISNARGEWNSVRWSGSPERTYNEFYAAIKNLGLFQIVSAPGDADLVLQITFVEPTEVRGNIPYSAPVLRLVLLDPKTGIILWTLDEHLQVDLKQKNRDQKFDDGINNLVGYFKALYTQPAAEAK